MHRLQENNALDEQTVDAYDQPFSRTSGAYSGDSTVKRWFLRSGAAAFGAGLLLATGVAIAQDSASNPVALMVPYPPGGPSDAAARQFAPVLGKALGKQVLVENLGGVSGALGAQKVLAAPADGRYIFQGSPNEVILAPLANSAVKLRAEDFRLVHPTSDGVMVLVARKDLAANSVDELIALARKNAAQPPSYGSVGIGSLYHLLVEKVQSQTGVTFTHAPYPGNAPLMQNLGGGQVDFAVLVYSAAMGALVQQGRVKLLAQLGAERSPLLKDVPTVSESNGLKDFSYKTWSAFMVPAKTPEPIVRQLHQAIVTTLSDPQLRSQIEAQTQIPAQPMSLEEAQQFFEFETRRYREIAKSIKLQPK